MGGPMGGLLDRLLGEPTSGLESLQVGPARQT